jgi:type IV pilus assembly protein PilY1
MGSKSEHAQTDGYEGAPGLNRRRRMHWAKAFGFLVGVLAAASSMPAMSVDISQQPLYLGSDVPGNLALVPSVEFPTLISVANFGDYNPNTSYVGYFDSRKCYEYRYDQTESLRHFYPVSWTNNGRCTGNSGPWSGNYLNWATTQTIDPFRSALTGGYRVRDLQGETWVEKAISDRDGGESGTANFPRRTLPPSGSNNGLIQQLTPVLSWGSIRTRIDGLGNKMRFSAGDKASLLAQNNPTSGGQPLVLQYDPDDHPLNDARFPPGHPLRALDFRRDDVVYELSVRVAVCVPNLLEPNCKQYGSHYKPEGLLQEYSNRIRYSIFGYQNNGGNFEPDGGIMRARQKYVGPQTFYPDQGPRTNPNAEWSATTGIQIRNPDPADASGTGANILDSGVINYLNKFGQMNTGRVAKSYDNVSELYYAANRYFRRLGAVPSYNALSADATTRRQQADGFPVITGWDDPIRYQCQTNVVLGIGDTNTWRDKNLPGNTSTAGESNAKASQVANDTTVDVVEDLYRIWRMEGYNHADASNRSRAAYLNNSGHNNSAYIAALAYAAHTRDIRSDMDGKQTLSTYWVDVVENRDYKQPATNPYWLATKYGGFRVPEGFDPNNNNPTALPQALWRNTTDMVPGSPAFPRPDNFYVAADASRMVASLRQAFENIADEMRGSGSSFAGNTTRLEVGARTYQAQFYSRDWGGELNAYDADPSTGQLTLAWSATAQMPVWGPNNSTSGGRRIYFGRGSMLANFQRGADFSGTALSSASDEEIDYLRGDRSREGTTFRRRVSVLGDIVNSQPVYVGTPNARLYVGKTFTGADAYPAFVAANTSNQRTPVVYVGANDGMLHAFNADTGAEVFAFVPRGAMAAMTGSDGYSNPSYEHKYSVDGELTVADAYIGGEWKTILVGTLGRGGRSVFALDVTNPAAPVLLWEKSAADIPQLGNTLGKPIIAQVADGDWRVLLGNGPNSAGGRAQLITIRLAGGATTVVNTGAAADNGLSGVNAWASTASGFVDTVYAGDLNGNMWKMANLAGTASATLMFAAGSTQPITSTPLVARNPETTDTWVFFGTGRYLNAADVGNKDVQSWYGLIDDGAMPITRARLNEVSILAEGEVDDRQVRTLESADAAGANGWYIDLVPPGGGARGERMIVPNFFQGLTLIGTTRIPDSDDVCTPSGEGFTMAIDPFTGGRLPRTFFDVNGDGQFDSDDTLNGVPVSGIGYESSPNNPIFIGDVMYTSLDDGGSSVTKTSAAMSNLRRVLWRELIRE